jgi:hypothetical protein
MDFQGDKEILRGFLIGAFRKLILTNSSRRLRVILMDLQSYGRDINDL